LYTYNENYAYNYTYNYNLTIFNKCMYSIMFIYDSSDGDSNLFIMVKQMSKFYPQMLIH